MSKWVNTDKYKSFVNDKKEEKVNDSPENSFFEKWENPKMGTQDEPAVYRVRLLPDKNGDFYKKYYYHFFQSDEKTHYIKCPKSDNFENFCPWCYANQQLWKGNASDKKRASRYKRNVRFVSNVFIADDPRDHSRSEDKKVVGKNKLYEFPATLETKIKKELTDEAEGFGPEIFDPEDGRDFIISILAKKPDANQKVWPDYSLTGFSRKKGPILDATEGIEAVMETVYDLTDYINRMGLDWKAHEKLLKSELLWDEVDDKFRKEVGHLLDTPEKESEDKPEPETKAETKTETKVEKDSSDKKENKKAEDIDDEELLNQLKDL